MILTDVEKRIIVFRLFIKITECHDFIIIDCSLIKSIDCQMYHSLLIYVFFKKLFVICDTQLLYHLRDVYVMRRKRILVTTKFI